MNKTWIKEVFANIKHTKVTFISIFMFVLLGVCLYNGLEWTGKDLLTTAETHFQAGNKSDFEILFPYGIDEEGLDKLRALDEVSEAEGVYSTYQLLRLSDYSDETHIISITDNIDIFSEIEGTLPQRADEICLDKNVANDLDLEIGDTVTFEDNSSQGEYLLSMLARGEDDKLTEELQSDENICRNPLKYSTFTITAIVENPRYMSLSYSSYGTSVYNYLQADSIFYVRREAFDTDNVPEYGIALVRCDKLTNPDSFSDEYKTLSMEIQKEISETADEIATESYRKVLDTFDEVSDIIENKISEGEKEIQEGQKQLEEGKAVIAKAEEEISSGKKEAEQAGLLLENSLAQITASEAELDKYAVQLSEAKRVFDPLAAKYYEAVDICRSTRNDLATLIDGVRNAESISEEVANEIINKAGTLLNDVKKARNFVVNFDLTKEDIPDEVIKEIDDFIELEEQRIDDVANGVSSVRTLFDIPGDAKTTITRITDCIGKYIHDTEDEISHSEQKIASGRQEIASSKAQYEAGKREYEAGLDVIKEAEEKLEEQSKTLEEGETKLKEGIKELSLIKEYCDRWSDNEDVIEDYGAIISPHTGNHAFFYIEMLSNIIRKIKFSTGGLLLIISILMCYSAITRMINLQMKLIGTKKALGFGGWRILAGYMLYTAMATVPGAIAGSFAAGYILEPLTVKSVCTTYTFKCTGPYFSVGGTLAITGCMLLLVLMITALACLILFKKEPLVLLMGKGAGRAGAAFYEKTGLWKRMSVFARSTFNNLINDYSRVIATLVGIAGCCALIVSAISLKENVVNCFNAQHEEYSFCDRIIRYENSDPETQEDIRRILDDEEITASGVYRMAGYVGSDKVDDTFVHLVVYDDTISDILRLKSTDDDNPMDYEGIWLPESMEKEYGLEVGESMSFKALDGTISHVVINGYYRNYSYNMKLLMDRESYKKIYGTSAVNNAFFVDMGDADFANLEKELQKVSGYIQTYDSYGNEAADMDVFEMLSDILAGSAIVVGILMSIFVSLNLLMVFVDEKKIELIVMMINGYLPEQAKRYIYSDTILLGVTGVVLGVILGFAFGDNSISAFESRYLYLSHDENITAALAGVIITGVLTAVMLLIALKRVGKFTLADINKM